MNNPGRDHPTYLGCMGEREAEADSTGCKWVLIDMYVMEETLRHIMLQAILDDEAEFAFQSTMGQLMADAREWYINN